MAYKGQRTEVEIPNEIEGYPVTRIEAFAFMDNNTLENLILPQSVKCIGTECFWNVSSLKSITIPKSVISIGRNAFYNSIREVVFEDGITKIPDYACYGATNLENIILPESVTYIGASAFHGCEKINGQLILDGNIESIGEHAF